MALFEPTESIFLPAIRTPEGLVPQTEVATVLLLSSMMGRRNQEFFTWSLILLVLVIVLSQAANEKPEKVSALGYSRQMHAASPEIGN